MVEEGDGCYGGQGDGPKGVEHIPQQRVEEPVPVTQQQDFLGTVGFLAYDVPLYDIRQVI